MHLAYEVTYPPGDKQQNLPPVLMLHGMIDNRKTWKHVAPKIAESTGRLVYAVDARNHGESPWSNEIDWVILADDIGHFLLQHDIPKATLVGHSMGGRAAFTLALKKPEMVEKLIVEEMSVRPIRVTDGSVVLNLISLMKEALNIIPSGVDEETGKKTLAEFMKELVPEDQISLDPSSIDMDFIPLKKQGDTFKWQANLEVLEDFLSSDTMAHDVSQLGGTYNGDTMFVYGTESYFGLDKDQWIEKFFPRAVKVPFEGATHLVHHEFPSKFTTVVSDFINKGSVPSSKI